MGTMMMSNEQLVGLAALPSRFDEVDRQLQKILAGEARLQDTLAVVLQVQAEQSAILQQILGAVVQPPPASTFVITETQEKTTMATQKHAVGVDVTILLNGTAIATISSITDANGNPVPAPTGLTVPAWVSSDPASMSVVAAADGMSAQLTGLAVATGVTATATATYVDATGATQTVTGTSEGNDIVPAPPGTAAKFVISEA